MSDGPTIDAELTPAVTWRGRDGAGRAVVFKRLPADCLRGGRPHPAVALRLTRLREAPVAGLAQLIGVERVGDDAVTVREWVDGRPLADLPPAERTALLPAVRRLVESLHRVGLVHGAVSAGNLIVEPGGTLRLVDPSPLLYDDPATDLADLVGLGSPSPTARRSDAAGRRWHRPSLAAAITLTLLAVAAAAGWAVHVAGRP